MVDLDPAARLGGRDGHGVTDPDAPVGRRHSLVLIPTGTPGMTVLRNTPTMTDY